MRKLLSFCMVIIMVLSLTACHKGQTAEPEDSNAPETTLQEQPAAQIQPPSADQLGREEHTDLVFFLEGLEEKVPASLQMGQDYSIYIPDEGWQYQTCTVDGFPAETWQSMDNENVQLQIVDLGHKDLAEVQSWVKESRTEYDLIEDQQGGLGGTDADGNMLDVSFHPSEESMYVVFRLYPVECTEGFGTRLYVMADTFAIYG